MSTEIFSLDGKTAVITGAGRGIGRTLALDLAKAGANLVLASRTKTEIEQLAHEIEGIGSKAIAVPVDVTKNEDLTALMEKSVQAFGKVDVLVNNAGVTRKKPAVDVSEEDWDFIINTNLKGMFFCAQTFGKHMINNSKGSIINLASVGSKLAITESSIYCASKGGLLQITRALAVEWAKYGVRVNAVGPAYIDTPLLSWLKDRPDVHEKITSRTPMGRLGRPEEISGAVIFLASDAASYVTGETIFVDGGLLSYGI